MPSSTSSASLFNGIDFGAGNPKAVDALAEVSKRYPEMVDEAERGCYPAIRDDPYLWPPAPLHDQEQEHVSNGIQDSTRDNVNMDALLKRYLIAENLNAAKALVRLQKTIEWRAEWDIMAMRAPGAAEKFLSGKASPGAEAYFVDSGLTDKTGTPYLVGRLCVCSSENMHPWRHLMAAVFVIERMAAKLAYPNFQAQYILDIRYIDFQATYSGTGGKNGKTTIVRNKGGVDETRDAPTEKMLRDFGGKIAPGMGVLKAAMKIIQNHYPEMLRRIIFYESAAWFTLMFKVFSLWTSSRTREKFLFVGSGWLHWKPSKLLEYFDEDKLPEEFGGKGPSLRNDKYIEEAVEKYEAESRAM